MLHLLLPNPTDNIKTEVTWLFTEWGVITWHVLEVFKAVDVLKNFESSSSVSQGIQKRLGYIIDYAKIGELVSYTTIRTIVKAVYERTSS